MIRDQVTVIDLSEKPQGTLKAYTRFRASPTSEVKDVFCRLISTSIDGLSEHGG